MKNQWKSVLGLLVLCAVCLLLGKGLQQLTQGKETKTTQGGEAVGQKQESSAEQEKENSCLTAEQQEELQGFSANGECIVLDAGHGGMDPGKVGVNQVLEKDINLAIVTFLQSYLEEAGFRVVMTRDSDAALYTESDSNKKAADMKARIRKIEEQKPIFAVSIHQNSFTQESSFGAQVFYYKTSMQGAELAKELQQTLREHIADGNYREAKANDSYYLLKKSPCPMVIVECGFLSNAQEAERLATEEYQKQVAWAICMGIVNYYREQE